MWIWYGYLMENYHICYYKRAQTSQGYMQFTALTVYAALDNHQIKETAIAVLSRVQLR